MTVEGFTISNQVYVPQGLRPDHVFEQRYISLRQKEQRLYTDEILLKLPAIGIDHVHFHEWQLRKRSANRLVNYLIAKKNRPNILEIGCGNGWLSRMLVEIPGSHVIGSDINFTELQQAARVFSAVPNLLFIYGDLESGILDKMEYDCIVLASCIQYFKYPQAVISQALQLLRPGGEIHIFDSPFYKPADIELAKKRTAEYYVSLGYGEMSRHYFHHSMDQLEMFQPDILYKPAAASRFLPGKRNPFPWIRIKQSALNA